MSTVNSPRKKPIGGLVSSSWRVMMAPLTTQGWKGVMDSEGVDNEGGGIGFDVNNNHLVHLSRPAAHDELLHVDVDGEDGIRICVRDVVPTCSTDCQLQSLPVQNVLTGVKERSELDKNDDVEEEFLTTGTS